MKCYLIGFLFLGLSLNVVAQDDLSDLFKEDKVVKDKSPVYATFKATKLVNAQTIEQIKRGELDFRIAHRFDDAGGKAGGVQTFYGFDNATDIRFSFDYGLTNNWCIGIARSKGAYNHRQLVDLASKYKIITQRKQGGFPLSISAYVISDLTTMKSSTDIYSVTYFKNNFAHRLNYVGQFIIARKFSSAFSLELLPTFIHRNYVFHTDKNNLFALGVGGRVKFTKRMGVIFDYYQVFDAARTSKNGFYSPLGLGLEIETGGHVFQLSFSNNKGLIESQYLTENKSNWMKGEFRFGFNISRVFNLINK